MKLIDFGSEFNKVAGDFSILVPEHTRVYESAQAVFAQYLEEHPDVDLVYADSDIEGGASEIGLRPAYSPELLLERPYIGGVMAVRTRMAGEVFVETSLVGLYEFLLKLTEKTTPGRVGHVAKVLSAQKIDHDIYFNETDEERGLKEAAIVRRGSDVHLETISDVTNATRVYYDVQGEPLVSIVIPSKDHYGILRQCIDSLRLFTDYKNYEIIVVDNGSLPHNKQMIETFLNDIGAKYIYKPMEFNFSRMCNIGVTEAKGDFILLLNDDVQACDGKWLNRMLGQAQRDYVGAVGAKLYFPGGTLIQHCGVVELSSGPSHVLFQRDDQGTYPCARNIFDFNYSAVTAACMLISKEKYEKVGGFDESLAVTYNDVDFCYKLLEAGFLNVVRNDAILYHHESLSRGQDMNDDAKRLRLDRELVGLHGRHRAFMDYDPYYNPALIDYDVTWEVQPRTVGVELQKGKPHLKQVDGGAEVTEIGFGYNVHIEGRSDAFGADVERYLLFEGSDGDYIKTQVEPAAGDESRFVAEIARKHLRIDLKSYRLYLITQRDNGAYITPLNRMTLIRGKKESEKLMCHVSPRELALPKDRTSDVVFNLDEIWCNDEQGLIRGFAFQKKDKRQEYYETTIILRGQGQTYEVSVRRQDRMDVSWAFKNRPYLEESGFVCNLPKGYFPAGTYNIGILITNSYTKEAFYADTKKELVWM